MSNKAKFKRTRQLAVRLPDEVYDRAVEIGPKPSQAIVAALRLAWDLPEPTKRTEEIA